MDKRQCKMIGHGAIVMFIGLVAGFGLLMDLIGGFEIIPGTMIEFELFGDSRAWARAHAGGIMNGILVMVGALLIYAMRMPDNRAGRLYWMLVGAGYANTLFYWGALLAPSRALTFGDNRLGESNLAGVVGALPAFVFAFITMVAMVIVMAQAFGAQDSD